MYVLLLPLQAKRAESFKELVYKNSVERIESIMKASEQFKAPEAISDGITVKELKVIEENTRNFHVEGWFECLGADGKVGKHTYTIDASYMDDFLEGGASLLEFTNATIDNTVIPI